MRGWIAWEKATLAPSRLRGRRVQPLIALGLWVSGGVDSYLGPILGPADPVRRLLLPAPARVAARGHRDRDVLHAVRVLGCGGSPLARRSHRDVRRRLRRPGRDDPVPQGVPRRRRAAPAPDGARGPADRSSESPRLRSSRWTTASPRGVRSRSSSSTSTASRRSTTPSATRSATRCSARSPRPRGPRCARPTRWRGSAGTSSRSSRRAPGSTAPRASPRLCTGPSSSVRPTDASPPVTLTISCASYPEDGVDRDALLRAADQRLHEMKDMRPSAAGAVAAPVAFSLTRA